jgi:hypothetical protein
LLLGEDGSGYVKHALDGTPVYAEINWSDGSSYKGGWSRDNKATGRGKYLNNEKGLEYSGWFSDGEAEGEGVLTIPEVTFKGTFRSGKVHDGTVISANGSVATGMWVDGKLTGAGTQKTDRGSYEGNFLEGEYDGEGKWRNTSTPEEYIGGFRQGMFERGTGIWLSQDGTQRFEGEWDRGRPNGQGQSWFPEGIYKGNFVDGQPGGQGRLSTPEGFVWDGNWTAGQPESGKVTWPDGSRFEGSFRNGKPDTGRYFDRHGRELRDPAGVRDHGLRGLRDGSDTEAVHHPRPGEICWTSARGDFVCLRARPGRPPNY